MLEYNINRDGVSALIISIDNKIDLKNLNVLAAIKIQLEKEFREFIIDLVPSYASIQIIFNIELISYDKFFDSINKLLASIKISDDETHYRNITLPVYYDYEETDNDLKWLSETLDIKSIEEIINIHLSITYRVFSISFMPGFPFLGVLDKRLKLARRASPRVRVPKGSVAIAGLQCGIYSEQSPGGWHILGKTPINMFNANDEAKNYSYLEFGDNVKFEAITKSQYEKMLISS